MRPPPGKQVGTPRGSNSTGPTLASPTCFQAAVRQPRHQQKSNHGTSKNNHGTSKNNHGTSKKPL